MACQSVSYAAEALTTHYKFYTSIGQVILDSSGNNYHATLGQNLEEDDSDPIPTDRGMYFTSSTYVNPPSNALILQEFIPLSNFYIFFFAFIISNGNFFSITNSGSTVLTLTQDSSSFYLTYMENGSPTYLFQSSLQTSIK